MCLGIACLLLWGHSAQFSLTQALAEQGFEVEKKNVQSIDVPKGE